MKKMLNHPATRIILGILVCLVVFIATQNIASRLLKDTGKEIRNLVKGILSSIAVISAFRWFLAESKNALSMKSLLKLCSKM